ncbi:MAG: hypothetical protein AB8H79_12635 [Myxococcota bacterium]
MPHQIEGQHLMIWVIEYGISHGRNMTICVHTGTYPKGAYFRLRGVESYFGPFETGPLDLRTEFTDHGVVIHGEGPDGNLRIACDSVEFLTRR